MSSESNYLPQLLRLMSKFFEGKIKLRLVSELENDGVLFVEDGNHGQYRPLPHEFVDAGVPFVRPPDLVDGQIDLNKCEKINEAAFNRVRKGIGKGGDIVLTHNATIGRLAITKNCDPVFVTNPQTTVWRSTNTEVIDPKYLYFFMKSSGFQEQLEAHKGRNATFDYVSLTKQRSLVIPVLDIDIQRNVASILTFLNERISLLRKTNATLEAIAQAIFKSWFVDFDPVLAKREGRIPEGMDEATAALFPDSFEESELGLVPRGWSHSTVSESFTLTMGQSPPGHTYNSFDEGLPFYQGRTDFGLRFPTKRIYCTAPTRIAEIGDTLVSVRAPVGDVNMAIEKCCLGRGVASVRHQRGYKSFTFYAIKSLRQRFEMFNSEGTVFGSINKKDFEALPVIKATSEILETFDAVAAPLDNRIVENEEQMRTLAELRDTLLPRLISGQLRLPETDSSLEEMH